MKLLVILFLLTTASFAYFLAGNRVPSNIVGMSPISSASEKNYALLMDKSAYRLTLYSGSGSDIKPLKSFHAIFGKQPGNKFTQGDGKTPEGIYFIQEIMDEANLRPEFGKKAFVLNYPNPIDKLNGKTGLGIWIHSVDDPKRLELMNDTRGCIAISNKNILELSEIVGTRETPVIIVNKTKYIESKNINNDRKDFSEFLNTWKSAWESSDIPSYISSYSESFYSTAKKMNMSQWKSYKTYISQAYRGKIKIDIDNVNIYNFGQYATILFKQNYRSPGLNDTGKKLLYLEREGNFYRIVSESWFPLSGQVAVTPSKRRLP